ncbi:MAG: tetratricopeptide repeat protein [Treponema sp.]|nr:tetratricopeptide repeat protein [Treponema sp.]
MPSLKDLEEFKSSFANVGNETEVRMEHNLPVDDLPLPDYESRQETEEIPGFEEESTPEQPDTPEDFLNFGDLGDLLGSETDLSTGQEPSDQADQLPGDQDDFDALLDSIPDDLSTIEEKPAEPVPADEINLLDKSYNEPAPVQENEDKTAADHTDLDFTDDNFEIPSELLNGLSDDLENNDEIPSGDNIDTGADLSEEFSIGDLPDFAFDEPSAPSEPSSLSEPAEPTVPADSANPMEEIQGELESPDESEDSFDMGGEFLEEAPPADTEDSFDMFNPGSNNEAADFNQENQDFVNLGQNSGMGGDFALPGIDDVFGPQSPLDDETGVDEIMADSNEIQLTDDEVARLSNTLASYPLNLRIACQELITEEIVAPDQMSVLINDLTSGASAKSTAALAGRLLGRTIQIPKGFEKMTGEQLETEQASFAYIFIHNFLPVLRTFFIIALTVLSLGYLIWTFIYQPLKAESIYKRGYAQISAGEYGRAKDLFTQAFGIHQNKEWYYRYAQAYRDERQYIYAEEKYDELLNYTASKNKRFIPEKRAVLEYADMETNYLRNYSKADDLLRRNILDFSPGDREGLLAVGDNSLAWGDIEPARYEDARAAYAVLMERYGRTDPVLERMLKYFIRTDNLGEVIPLQIHFMSSDRTKISAETLAELGGYLMDKRTQDIQGVPSEYLSAIGGIRDVLLRAIRIDPLLPESYFHLSRYYNYFSNFSDEELTLQRAIQCFDAAKLETAKRLGYRLQALRRYAEIFTQRGQFLQAGEYLAKGTSLFEDGLSRRIITASPEFGRLYADLGDLEFYTKDGNASAALNYYLRSEQYGYAPPEILYRMGAAYYQLKQWSNALDRFTAASFPQPYNEKILYALGNASYMRGNYFAAQAYYDRLIDILNDDKLRFPLITPTDNKQQQDLAERLMVAQNNLGVTLDALTLRTGDNSYRSRAMGLYADSEQAWDILTRDPTTMVRMRPSPDITAPGVNPAYLNIQNSLYPIPGYEPILFMRIDQDLLQPSAWDNIAPQGYSLAEGVPVSR